MVVLYCDRRHKGGGFSVWCLATDLEMEPLVYNTSHFYFDWRHITGYCDSQHTSKSNYNVLHLHVYC